MILTLYFIEPNIVKIFSVQLVALAMFQVFSSHTTFDQISQSALSNSLFSILFYFILFYFILFIYLFFFLGQNLIRILMDPSWVC